MSRPSRTRRLRCRADVSQIDEVATFYDAESEVLLEQLTTTLEPAILVVMGGIVVTILLAIYMPIIQSISSGPMVAH